MIKCQRFVPFLFKTLQKPFIPLTFINNQPSHHFTSRLVSHPFANFTTQNDSNETLEKSDEAIIQEWGTKVAMPKKERKQSMIFPDYCVKVALRVIETCIIYGESTAEELAKLTKESRFYYVKKKFDEMGEKDAEEFVKFLKAKDDVAGQILREKLRLREIEESSLPKGAFKNMLVGERDNLSFLQFFLQRNPRYRAIIFDLAMEFMDGENPDYKSLMTMRDEENRIGTFQPAKKPTNKLTRMAEYREELKQKLVKSFAKWEKNGAKEFEKVLKKSKSSKKRKDNEDNKDNEDELEKQKKPVKYFIYSPHRLLRVGLTRLTSTMLIYLRAPQHVVEKIPKVSRFYYVHEKLKDWNEEEKLKLWSYLDSLRGNVHLALPEGVVIDKVKKNLGMSSQEELYYILHHKTYGKLCTELLQEFLKENNMDQFYYFNAFEDEYEIGKFSPPVGKMSAAARIGLQDNLEQCKERLQDTIKASSYEELAPILDAKTAERRKKIIAMLREKRMMNIKAKKAALEKAELLSRSEPNLESKSGSESGSESGSDSGSESESESESEEAESEETGSKSESRS